MSATRWTEADDDREIIGRTGDEFGGFVFAVSRNRPRYALVIERWGGGRMLGCSFIGTVQLSALRAAVMRAYELAVERFGSQPRGQDNTGGQPTRRGATPPNAPSDDSQSRRRGEG